LNTDITIKVAQKHDIPMQVKMEPRESPNLLYLIWCREAYKMAYKQDIHVQVKTGSRDIC